MGIEVIVGREEQQSGGRINGRRKFGKGKFVSRTLNGRTGSGEGSVERECNKGTYVIGKAAIN